MERMLEGALKKHRCLVARADYGYDVATPRGWEECDLAWTAPQFAPSAAPGLVLRSADCLPGWAGTRDYADVWQRIALRAAGQGFLLVCRFPRRAVQVRDALVGTGVRAGYWETPSAGEIPPLYSRIPADVSLKRLHLEHEWSTGMAAARGGTALVRIGALLAEKGPRSVPDLASDMGISSGAARSYVRWMEDAALVRREGRFAALRHPLLAELFLEKPVPESRPPVPPVPPQKKWDPVELD